MEELDLRGFKCPEPAIRTGKALRDTTELTVIVDDEEAVQNISRGVLKRGFEIDVKEKEDGIYLYITKGEDEEGEDLSYMFQGPVVAFFASDGIGQGDETLGKILAKSIIYSFLETEDRPDMFIFMNGGVRLACEGSESLEDLKKLQEDGVEILVCGTCLDFLELKEKLAIGEVSNAYTISETLMEAGKVIKF